MQHQHWINEARAHWQEFQPTRFKTLTDSGELDKALQQAANATAQEMDALIGQRVPAQEEWMQVRRTTCTGRPSRAQCPKLRRRRAILRGGSTSG